MNVYESIIDMLKNSVSQHPSPETEYQKGFIAGMNEAIAEITIAMNHKE